MITSRTPLRLSFFGGGTDYPEWYRQHGGAVLGTTISHYAYITCRYLPPFFDYNYMISYSQIEHAKTIAEIKHPSVRETLRFTGVNVGVALHFNSDLPARTGLGSSSTFTVGLLNALYAFLDIKPDKMKLARDAIHIEQNMIRENVGAQDQTAAAFGGFNLITFNPDDSIKVSPVAVEEARLRSLERHLMLIFTGFVRNASEIAELQIKATREKGRELSVMHEMVGEGVRILTGVDDLCEFGKLLHESWRLKRSLTPLISNPRIDEIYDTARSAGALGGKLLGAGGGGFILLFVTDGVQEKVRKALGGLLEVPFRFETSGSQIIFHDPDGHYPDRVRSAGA